MTRCTAGEKPDPADAADRAAVDAVFEGLARAIAERPPEERAFIETRSSAGPACCPPPFAIR